MSELAAIAAFGITVVLAPVVLVSFRRLGVLDHPNERSSHDVPVVRGGGLPWAVASLAAVGMAVGPGELTRAGMGVLVAATGCGLLGLVEDLRGVPPAPRFGAQVAVAAASLSLILPGTQTGAWWLAVLGICCLLGLAGFVNAFNFMDGINGISAVQSVVAAVAWVWIGHVRDVDVLVWGGLVLFGSAAGFLPFNFPNAKMFLGDVGSYFIGAWQAALVVVGLTVGVPPEAVAAPLVVYVADTGLTFARRVRAGDPWHLPHREHAYQRLVRQGWSHPRTTSLVGLFVAACSAAGLLTLGDLPARVLGNVLLVALAVAYLAVPHLHAANFQRRSGVT